MLKPISIFVILFLLVLSQVSLLMRLNQYDAVAYHDENSGFYLIANHIRNYHEFPLRGPHDEGFSFLPNSPFFYYFLSFFLYIKDDFYFLEAINIFFQIANVIFVYLIARRLFNIQTGLISASIFALGNYFVSQSNYLSQYAISQSFTNIGYLLLSIGYLKKRYSYLIASLIILILSSVIHRSNVPQLIISLAFILLILKYWKAELKKYFLTMLVFIASLFVLYLPVFFVGKLSIGANSISLSSNMVEFSQFLKQNIAHFLEAIFIGGVSPALKFLLIIFFINIFTLRRSKTTRSLFPLCFIVIAISLQFLLTAAFRLNAVRYFTPTLGLFVVLISFALVRVAKGNIFNNLIGIVLFILLISMVSPNVFNKLNGSLKVRQKAIFSPAVAVIDKVAEIKRYENLSHYNFFRIITYRNKVPYFRLDSAFWVPLEKAFKQRFVTINDKVIINVYSETNADSYNFIVCYEYNNENDIKNYCLTSFFNEKKNFILRDLVYQGMVNGHNISVYLAKRV